MLCADLSHFCVKVSLSRAEVWIIWIVDMDTRLDWEYYRSNLWYMYIIQGEHIGTCGETFAVVLLNQHCD